MYQTMPSIEMGNYSLVALAWKKLNKQSFAFIV